MRSNPAAQLFDLFFEFLITHLTILSFISLTGILSAKYELLRLSIVLLVSILTYLILSDVFIVFLSRYKLTYGITTKGILFNWGVLKSREVFVPFEEIESINLIDYPKLKRKAIQFKVSSNITNGDLGTEIGALSYVLSFERLTELEPIADIFKEHYQGVIRISSAQKTENPFYRFSKSKIYHKLNLFMAFSFIYLAAFIGIKIFDNNIASQIHVKDIVVEEKITRDKSETENNLITSKGYDLTLYSFLSYVDKEIEFTVTPVYCQVSSFSKFKYTNRESLKNGYIGDNLIMKIFCFLILSFFAVYIIYKRGNLYRDDYIMIIFGPVLVTIVGGFILYH